MGASQAGRRGSLSKALYLARGSRVNRMGPGIRRTTTVTGRGSRTKIEQISAWNTDSRTSDFCRAANATVKGVTMTLLTTLSPTRDTARPAHLGNTSQASAGTWLHIARDLLRGWRQRLQSRRQLRNLCELDDHILRDIGLTRTALRWEAEKLFRR